MSADQVLVHIEVRFRADGDVGQISDRIRESISMIVGRTELEDFRVRTLPLTESTKEGKRPRA